MKQSTMTTLAMLVFVLVFISFVIRGFGQVLVGPRTAMLIAGPVSVLAAGVLLFVVVFWMLSKVGISVIASEGE